MKDFDRRGVRANVLARADADPALAKAIANVEAAIGQMTPEQVDLMLDLFDRSYAKVAAESARKRVADFAKTYPDVWRQVDACRGGRGVHIPDWPQECFLADDICRGLLQVGYGTPAELQGGEPFFLATLASWRVGQNVYLFDSSLYEALSRTSLTGELAADVFMRLPAWCCYIVTPGLRVFGEMVLGAWVYLGYVLEERKPELWILFDAKAPIPWRLPLGEGSIEDSIRGMMEKMQALFSEEEWQEMRRGLHTVAGLALYLCADDAEIGDGKRRAATPKATRVRGVMRLFPPDKPAVWEVGVRMGRALRRAEQQAREQTARADADPTGRTVRPHIRTPHWHGFWSGPRSDATKRRFSVKWLPPIAVKVNDLEELPAVIHPVKG